MEFSVCQLVAFGDRHQPVYIGKHLQVFVDQQRFVSDHTDDCHLFSFGEMSFQSFGLNQSSYFIDRLFWGVWFHYNDHDFYPFRSSW